MERHRARAADLLFVLPVLALLAVFLLYPLGYGLALSALAIGVAIVSEQWREWLTGGETSERALMFAREVGLTGLLFLAGARFDLRKVWQQLRVSSALVAAGLLLMAVIAILLDVIGEQDSYEIVATSAAVAAVSLWLPGETSPCGKASHRAAVDRDQGRRRRRRGPGRRGSCRR